MRWSMFVSACVAVAACASGFAEPHVDPDHRFAWSENVGWTNWQHDAPKPGDGVFVTDTFLAGFTWAENVGWINVGNGTPTDGVHYANANGSDFGVNVNPETGNLFGLAWGENIGWINFDTASLGDERARFDACHHRFFGFAWGENVGWINLNDSTHFVAVGPCGFGDLDCDDDVDLTDFAGFQNEFSGPGADADCPAFDADDDNDVDLLDWGAFQQVFTGE